MALQKPLGLSSGKRKQLLPAQTSAGVADADKLIATGADGKLSATFLPTGVGIEVRSILTSEALTAGCPVNIYNNGGTLNVRKAAATSEGLKADGFVLAAYGSGVMADVYLEDGTISGLTGLTLGSEYFLGDTPGTYVLVASIPTTAGHIIQPLGKALSATELEFTLGDTDELS